MFNKSKSSMPEIPKPVQIPKQEFTTQSNEKNSTNYFDETYFYKFPRKNKINTLINEFFATRVAATVASRAKFDLVIPEIRVKLEKENPCLQISLIPNYKDLKSLGNKFSKSTYNQQLLQSLLIDLLVGNIDGHLQNLGLDSENRLTHIDFDLSFKMDRNNPIEGNIKEIANAIRSGFAQGDLIQGSNIKELKEVVKAMRSIPGIEKTLIDCLIQAAAELRTIPKILEVNIDLALATAQMYIQNQLEKFASFEVSTAEAPKIVAATPCKNPPKRTISGKCKPCILFNDPTKDHQPEVPLSIFFSDINQDLPTSPGKRQRTSSTGDLNFDKNELNLNTDLEPSRTFSK